MIHWRSVALAGSAGRAVWVGRGVDVGAWVAVGSGVAVGAIAVTVSFAPAVAVLWARVCDAGTSTVGPADALDAHADSKTNKIIASAMFVFMMSPICILDRYKAG